MVLGKRPGRLLLLALVLSGAGSDAITFTGGVALAQEVSRDVEEAGAEPAKGGHVDPFSFIMLEFGLLIAFAMVGRWIAGRLSQAPVLGELVTGVVVGNVGYWIGLPLFILVMNLGSAGNLFEQVWDTGQSMAEAAPRVFSEAEMAVGGAGRELLGILSGSEGGDLVLMGAALWIFSSLGVILLLFMVGLESSVTEMLKVGPQALMVATLGIVGPFVLGLLGSTWLLPDAGMPTHLFLAATLSATSVGITARVFKDLGKLQTGEAKIILGAAVIDDVLGLIILAIVVGIVATGQFDLVGVTGIIILSLLFLGSVIFFGERFMRRLVSGVRYLDRPHGKLLFPLVVAFLMSWFANMIGLAAIVGAFAAGLILSDEHFGDEWSPSSRSMQELIGPIEAIFAPIFFLMMGMQVNLKSFLDTSTLTLAFVLTVAAVVGKVISGTVAGAKTDRLSIGLGMIPRGEVGLIFASIGKGLGVVTDHVFSALVVMVIVTTLITPPALRWSLFRDR